VRTQNDGIYPAVTRECRIRSESRPLIRSHGFTSDAYVIRGREQLSLPSAIVK